VQDPEFNPKFDPYDAMISMDHNIQRLIHAHNQLAEQVQQQQQVIDVLIKGLDAANKANEQILSQGLDRLYTTFAQGQH